jgi:hypothetical protein
MVAIPGNERSHNAEFVRQPCQLRKGASERDARDRGLDLARRAAHGGEGIHLGIKCLELRWTAVHEEENDGAVLEREILRGRGGPDREPVAQRQAAQGEAAHAQELSTVESSGSAKVILKGQHGDSFVGSDLLCPEEPIEDKGFSGIVNLSL